MRDKKKKGGMDKWWEEGSKSGEDNDEGDRQRGGLIAECYTVTTLSESN